MRLLLRRTVEPQSDSRRWVVGFRPADVLRAKSEAFNVKDELRTTRDRAHALGHKAQFAGGTDVRFEVRVLARVIEIRENEVDWRRHTEFLRCRR